MKRYGNLYSKIYDIENIKLAHKNAKRGKSHYGEVKMVDRNPNKYFTIIHNILKHKTFKNSKYKVFVKVDNGKRREIYKLPYFPDRIIHHCIMNSIMSYFGWIKYCSDRKIWRKYVNRRIRKIISILCDRNNVKNPLLIEK